MVTVHSVVEWCICISLRRMVQTVCFDVCVCVFGCTHVMDTSEELLVLCDFFSCMCYYRTEGCSRPDYILVPFTHFLLHHFPLSLSFPLSLPSIPLQSLPLSPPPLPSLPPPPWSLLSSLPPPPRSIPPNAV